MDKIKSHDFFALQEISHEIGSDIDLIQGAGGNSSLKENNILWVKASGCWLSDAIDKNIFVPINNRDAIELIENGNIQNIHAMDEYQENKPSMRPSIETALHALMPHKFVLHAHALNTTSISVHNDGEIIAKNLLQDLAWAWIPYVMPGLKLAKAVQSVLIKKPDVLILANHGLVVGGETAKEAIDLLKLVEERMARDIRKVKIIQHEKLSSIINNSLYRMPKYELSHTIAHDEFSLEVVKRGTLYPDHVVFLGPGPMSVLTLDEFKNVYDKSSYVDNNPVIIVDGLGVFVSDNFSENAESMLYCLAGILLRLRPREKLNYLTKQDEMHLMGWDAEKYRQSIQR